MFTVGDKDSIETKLSWRWCRDNFLLPSDEVTLIRCKQKTAYEVCACLVGSEMCIRDRLSTNKSHTRAVMNSEGTPVARGQILRAGDKPTLPLPYICLLYTSDAADE